MEPVYDLSLEDSEHTLPSAIIGFSIEIIGKRVAAYLLSHTAWRDVYEGRRNAES